MFKRLQCSGNCLFKLLCHCYFVVGYSVQTHVLQEALKDLHEDLQQGDDSDSFSDSSECDVLE